MADDHRVLLAEFEVRVRDLMAHCEKQKRRIIELEESLSVVRTSLHEAEGRIEALTIRNDNMLTARIVTVHAGDVQRARARLSQMVREVNRCIALAE
ncbi:MAG: hypothetical protein LBB27_01395 [Tannerellaceae bacterium]|jgi:hypothetical protein|nr:hypothetical protein [Tannerellaceae bacterium]